MNDKSITRFDSFFFDPPTRIELNGIRIEGDVRLQRHIPEEQIEHGDRNGIDQNPRNDLPRA